MKIGLSSVLLTAAVLLAAFSTVGCADNGPPPSEKTQQESSRLEQIQRRSGGDWSKLTPEDRDYLVKELGQGSEQKAKMLLGPPSKPQPPSGIKPPGR